MCSASGTQLVMAGEGFAEGVDRAGADIAEDDADRADRQLGERALRLMALAGWSAGSLGGWRYRCIGQGGNAHSFICASGRCLGGAAP